MRRRGYLLIEVFVACTMVAALLALMINMISVTARERRTTERRAIALEQATNLLERASAIPHDELSPEKLAELALPADAAELLPRNTVQWTIADEDSAGPSRRVQVELTWHTSQGQVDSPVRLVAWSFPETLPAVAPTAPTDAASPEIPADTPPASEEDRS